MLIENSTRTSHYLKRELSSGETNQLRNQQTHIDLVDRKNNLKKMIKSNYYYLFIFLWRGKPLTRTQIDES